MRKILFLALGCLFILPTLADNVTTTKPYVDYNIAQKQDIIPGIPSDYTPVEYIRNATQTYINTNITPTSDDIEMEIRYYCNSTSSNYIFQSRPSTGSSDVFGFSGSATGATLNASYLSASIKSDITRTAGHIYRTNMRVSNGTMTFTVTDETTGQTDTKSRSITFNVPTVPMGIFGNTGGNRIAAGYRVFYAWIKENGRYVMNYIPVTYNNTPGFYDAVSGTFKGATSGSLVAGPAGIAAIVTNGASAGNIGMTPVVGSLGTDTTTQTVPTTGAVAAATNNKMIAVGRGVNWVMAGEIVNSGTKRNGAKPIYDASSRNYADALVTANGLNNAASRAADSELTCVDNDCTLFQLNTSVTTLNTVCKQGDVACLANSECCSNNCRLGSCTRMCAATGDSCIIDTDCCLGSCEKNVCSDPVACSLLGGTCGKGGLDCCAGLTCNKSNVCEISEATRCESDKDCPIGSSCCKEVCGLAGVLCK